MSLRELDDFEKIDSGRWKSFVRWYFDEGLTDYNKHRRVVYNYQKGQIEQAEGLFSEIIEESIMNGSTFGYVVKKNSFKYGKEKTYRMLFKNVIVNRIF